MSNAFITKTRVLLINIGKIAPFVVCGVVLCSYVEDIYALSTFDYIMFDNDVYLNKPISWFLGNYFTYDSATLAVLVIISFSVQTCVYNKLACLYMLVNLVEKSYFDFELEPTTIYIICVLNILVAGFLTWKGIKILLSK